VRCRLSETPLSALADFAHRLLSLGWDRASVEEVENGILSDMKGRRRELRQDAEDRATLSTSGDRSW
jgi:hypothetical protein